MKKLPTFKEWILAKEAGSVNRAKFAVAVGLPNAGPTMDTDSPSLNSRATVSPGLLDLINGKDSGYDKESGDKLDKEFGDSPKVDKDEYLKSPHKHKKHEKKVEEGHKPHPIDPEIDKWFSGADDVRDALRKLKDKFKRKPEKDVAPVKPDEPKKDLGKPEDKPDAPEDTDPDNDPDHDHEPVDDKVISQKDKLPPSTKQATVQPQQKPIIPVKKTNRYIPPSKRQ